jgi:hypothetical protein
MQINHLQNTNGSKSLIMNVQSQDAPQRPVRNISVLNDKISHFIIILSGGIAWGTMAGGFKGACFGTGLAIVVSYLTTRKH